MIGLRASPELRRAIEAWAKRQADTPGLSEAIRRLVVLGIARQQPTKQQSPKAAAKASDMAAEQIDRLADASLPEGERHARKRRLLKGPKEFRDMRNDQPKAKLP
jgi:hypothetical protein